MDFNTTELVGYFASFALMVSFAMKDVNKLRMINSIGCILFIIYGFMLNTSWPIVISNAFIVTMNFWHLKDTFKNA